jgi:hypothetical protein
MTKNQTLSKTVASIGEEIGYELGNQMVASFQNAFPSENSFFVIGRQVIDQILSQPGCVGLKVYNALNEQGEKTLVYMGLDATGKALLEYVQVNQSGAFETSPAIVADRIERGGRGSVGIDADDFNWQVD